MPGSSFYAHGELGRTKIRFCFPKTRRHADRGGPAAPEARPVSPRAAARAIFDAALRAADVRPLVLRALERRGAARPRPGGRRRHGQGLGRHGRRGRGSLGRPHRRRPGRRSRTATSRRRGGCGWSRRAIPCPTSAGRPRRGVDPGPRAARAGADDLVLVLDLGRRVRAHAGAGPADHARATSRRSRGSCSPPGATINQLNAVRKHCSLLKGGQLARAAAPARVHALLLSDVIGDPLDVIASGPTAPDASTFAEALAVLDRFELRDDRRLPSIVDRLERGVARRGAGDAEARRSAVRARERGRHRQQRAGRRTRRRPGPRAGLHPSRAHARARRRGARGGGRPGRARPARSRPGRGRSPPPACLIAGGEITVTVRGAGRGGRCQELALAAALALDGVAGAALLAAGTDGSDGPTDAAGAIVDGGTAARARAQGARPRGAPRRQRLPPDPRRHRRPHGHRPHQHEPPRPLPRRHHLTAGTRSRGACWSLRER